MTYRMLALSIDGTLLRSNSRLSRQTKDAIEYVKEKGVYITLATERPFPAAKKIAKALKLDNVLITHDGGFIASDVDEPLLSRKLHEDKTFHIAEILENYKCHIRLLHEQFSIGNKVRQKNQLIARMTLGIQDPLYYPVTFVDSICEHLMENPVAPPKIQAQFFSAEEAQAASMELQKEVPSIDTIVRGERLEIVPKGISKARGVQVVANHLGISLEQVVAIGAGVNDIDMITQAGLGVAMGNSPEELKASADWITRSNDMHGVAYMVKEVFRKQLKVNI
ncbi:HAD family hydrolase [Bacillus alkalicellulosilyticus]|uniref:HAD family hydrolase n=1 Tax=Alkalihalobacterium alkalicellulosilyticum TaxID=1912214 RepID=UPI0009966B22|nr:HAD family hydrolase [Bacillus alkalicellulosilyticus]